MNIAILLFFTSFLMPKSGIEFYSVKTGDHFYDSGGQNNYLDCSDSDMCQASVWLCASGPITLTFKSFGIFPSSGEGDVLSIYDGGVLIFDSRKQSGKNLIITSIDTCLLIVFQFTSIGNASGWDAEITSTSTINNPDSQPDKPDKECKLICKANVTVMPGNYSPFYFIMNPKCKEDDFILEFMTGGTTVTSDQVGQNIIYKVWLKNKTNHCWGNVIVKN